jgi:AcrR family transcriptional regulator
MKKEKGNKEKWIAHAYALFGEIGIEALNVEKLSILVGLSRSSFYYHFRDLNRFEEQLLTRHLENYQHFGTLIANYTKFDELFSEEVMVHKEALAFQRQLLVNRSVARYSECSKTAREYTEAKTFELWTQYKQVDPDSSEEWELFKSLRDFYFIHYGQSDQKPEDVLVLLHTYLSSKE